MNPRLGIKYIQSLHSFISNYYNSKESCLLDFKFKKRTYVIIEGDYYDYEVNILVV